MSSSDGPVRRRRIAGESGPAAPAKKAAVAKKRMPRPPGAKKAGLPEKKPLPEKTPLPKKEGVATRTSAASVTEPRAERPAGSRPSRRDVVWLVPAAFIAIAALVLGVMMILSPPGDDGGKALDTSRRQASSAAASAAETIFTFRYDQLDDHLAASKALMTPAFAKKFDSIAPALTELAPQRKIVVQAVAREAAALPCGSDCSSSKVDVLVFVDQARLVGDSQEPTVFANRIKVSMVKSDDGWLVSEIRAL